MWVCVWVCVSLLTLCVHLRPDIKRIAVAALGSMIQDMWATESSVRPTAAGVLSTLEAQILKQKSAKATMELFVYVMSCLGFRV